MRLRDFKVLGWALFVSSLFGADLCLAADLHLICRGGGAAVKHSHENAFAFGSNSRSASAFGSRTYDRSYEDEVEVSITDGAGTIRLPRGTLPPAHGGKDGWFQLNNLMIADNDITAKAEVNFINKPQIRISRITGAISIEGKNGSFSGKCEPFDPANAQRAF